MALEGECWACGLPKTAEICLGGIMGCLGGVTGIAVLVCGFWILIFWLLGFGFGLPGTGVEAFASFSNRSRQLVMVSYGKLQ